MEPRKLLRQPGAKQWQGPRGEQHAEQAADAAEQDVLGQRHAQALPAARADRMTDGFVLLSRERASV